MRDVATFGFEGPVKLEIKWLPNGSVKLALELEERAAIHGKADPPRPPREPAGMSAMRVLDVLDSVAYAAVRLAESNEQWTSVVYKRMMKPCKGDLVCYHVSPVGAMHALDTMGFLVDVEGDKDGLAFERFDSDRRSVDTSKVFAIPTKELLESCSEGGGSKV